MDILGGIDCEFPPAHSGAIPKEVFEQPRDGSPLKKPTALKTTSGAVATTLDMLDPTLDNNLSLPTPTLGVAMIGLSGLVLVALVAYKRFAKPTKPQHLHVDHDPLLERT